MKRIAILLTAASTLASVGCSRSTAPRSGPVPVAGKVTRAGKPVADVVVTFQPMDVGHPGIFPVKADGTFQGDLIEGKYMYYVAKGATPSSPAVLAKIDAKFQEPNLERSIAIAPNQEIQIALD
jgi:hypothetical protein